MATLAPSLLALLLAYWLIPPRHRLRARRERRAFARAVKADIARVARGREVCR